MDPYTPPSSTTAKPVSGVWPRRTTALLLALFIVVNLLRAVDTWQLSMIMGGLWPGGGDSHYSLIAAVFVIRAVAAALYFIGFRWFYWLILASLLAIYVVPLQSFPPYPLNDPASVTLVLAIGLGLARFGRQFLFPWRR